MLFYKLHFIAWQCSCEYNNNFDKNFFFKERKKDVSISKVSIHS